MPDSDYLGSGSDSEPGGGNAADEQWLHDCALIRSVLSGDSAALVQLCNEKLGPVIARSRGDCPHALVERFYKEGSDALAQLINTGGHELQRVDWRSHIQNIQAALAFELQTGDQEWLFVTLINSGNLPAEDHLLRKYEMKIKGIAYSFRALYPEIEDDLAQEGLIAFRDKVIPTYDPGKGVTLWEYARKIIWRSMNEASRKWAKPRSQAPLYLSVRAATRRLRNKYKREPTYTEIADECGVSTDDVREVMEAGHGRRESSLDKGWDDGEAQVHEVEDRQADPWNQVSRRARYDAVMRYLNENSGKNTDGHDGERWVLVFVLKHYEDYSWDDLLDILLGHKDVDWQSIHEVYSLPFSLPARSDEICRLFQDGGPKLTLDSLKHWYSRRSNLLQKSLKIGDPGDILD